MFLKFRDHKHCDLAQHKYVEGKNGHCYRHRLERVGVRLLLVLWGGRRCRLFEFLPDLLKRLQALAMRMTTTTVPNALAATVV